MVRLDSLEYLYQFMFGIKPVAISYSCACHSHSDPGGERDLLWTSESCKVMDISGYLCARRD
jgi:hypothetical protein